MSGVSPDRRGDRLTAAGQAKSPVRPLDKGMCHTVKDTLVACTPVTLLLAAAIGQPTGKFSDPRKLKLDSGVSLYQAERGKGEPITFIHGGMKDYRVWESSLTPFRGAT